MSFQILNSLTCVVCLFVIKSLSQTSCDTEANTASECFERGCCWNGFSGCNDCDTYCPTVTSTSLVPCSTYGCCPTVSDGIIQDKCQASPFVGSIGAVCCVAVDGECTALSINTGLCCTCSIDGVSTCGLQYTVADLRSTTLECSDCIETPTSLPTSSPEKSPTSKPTKYPTSFSCYNFVDKSECNSYSNCCYCEDQTYWEPAGCEGNCCLPGPSECCTTLSPTKKPSSKPSEYPSKSPSIKPTDKPSKNPTSFDCANIYGESNCELYSECCYCDLPEYYLTAGCEGACCLTEAKTECCETKNPTSKPTTEEPTTQEPTSKPTSKPTTENPTYKPTSMPTTEIPTSKPSSKPTTEETTYNPTAKPTTEEPSYKPTSKPTTKTPTTEDPTSTPTTPAPTIKITPIPTTSEPTHRPTRRSAEKWAGVHPEYKGQNGQVLWSIYYGDLNDDPRFDQIRENEVWDIEDYFNINDLPQMKPKMEGKIEAQTQTKTEGSKHSWIKWMIMLIILFGLLIFMTNNHIFNIEYIYKYISNIFKKHYKPTITTKLLSNTNEYQSLLNDGYEPI